MFGFVLTFAFLPLLASFRSVVIAARAVILNLLSVIAADGIVVAVLQCGWRQSLLDFQCNGAIAPSPPVFLFVILFGLSMDYHVFIVSRGGEARDRVISTADAVTHGITTTAGTVTVAAVVMAGAFSASMKLLGTWNWYLPDGCAGRVPRISSRAGGATRTHRPARRAAWTSGPARWPSSAPRCRTTARRSWRRRGRRWRTA